MKPSRIGKVFNRYTMRDIRTTLRLFLGNKVHSFAQDYQVLAVLMGQVFGNGSDGGTKAPPPPPVQTMDEFLAGFRSVFCQR